MFLNVGDAQGVTEGSKYSIHHNNVESTSNPRLGVLVVETVLPLSSVLSFVSDDEEFDLPDLFYARKIQDGATRPFAVYSENKAFLDSLFSETQLSISGFVQAPDIESADLILTIDDGEVTFYRNDTMITPHIGSRFPKRIPVDDMSDLHEVIQCARHFWYHLTRTGDDVEAVWLEMMELDGQEIAPTPIGPNILKADVATVPLERPLGGAIHNNTTLPLYPHVLYFDPNELSISKFIRLSIVCIIPTTS